MSSGSSASSHQLRVVFDTNIYIAAFLRPGMSEELVKRGLYGEFTVLCSEYILGELKRKMGTKFEFTAEQVGKYLDFIRKGTAIIEAPLVPKVILRDPDDNHILACAQAGKANLIITLDKDLLDLKEWEGVAIVHPKTFSWIVSG